jgi:hypothetical protein
MPIIYFKFWAHVKGNFAKCSEKPTDQDGRPALPRHMYAYPKKLETLQERYMSPVREWRRRKLWKLHINKTDPLTDI